MTPVVVVRKITKIELSPTPLTGAQCTPIKGGSCVNPPKFTVEYPGGTIHLCGVHERAIARRCRSLRGIRWWWEELGGDRAPVPEQRPDRRRLK
jgi:hypothetical protein